jgi:CBS domain containing-hemolysin-like protein
MMEIVLGGLFIVLTAGLLFFGLGTEALGRYNTTRLHDLVRVRSKPGDVRGFRRVDERLAREDLLLAAARHWVTALELSLVAVTALALGETWPLARRLAAAVVLSLAWVVIVRRGIARTLAVHQPERVLLALLPALAAAAVVMRPLHAAERFIITVVSRLMGVEEKRPAHEAIQDEILKAVDEGQREGVLAGEAAEMIEGVMTLRQLDVRAVMTPRTDMVYLPAEATLKEAARLVQQTGHGHIPVFRGNRDNVIGVIYAKDMLAPLTEAHGSDRPVGAVARIPVFVPETKPVWLLLQEFREARVQLAIVLDEYGGTAGIVTVEDILEEIVGGIGEDRVPGQAEPPKRLSEVSAEVDGRMRVDELNAELGAHVPEHEDFDTVGGLAFSVLGRVPAAGDHFAVSDVDFTVIEAGDHRVKRMRVEKQVNRPATEDAP